MRNNIKIVQVLVTDWGEFREGDIVEIETRHDINIRKVRGRIVDMDTRRIDIDNSDKYESSSVRVNFDIDVILNIKKIEEDE